MKTTVIHHSADYDGIFCREIARKFIPDAEIIGWDFPDKPIDHSLIMERDVFVMDLPLDAPVGAKFPEDLTKTLSLKGYYGANSTTWIDHHASAIASHPKDIPGYRIDGVAACRLAWQWFEEQHNGPKWLPEKLSFLDRVVMEPIAVRLAGEYDIWDKRDPNAELFQHGLRSEEMAADNWVYLLSLEDSQKEVDRLLEQGKFVQFAQKHQDEFIAKNRSFDVEFEGLKFMAINAVRCNSITFEAATRKDHDALLGFYWNGKEWNVSMYHAPHRKDLDLSAIAVRYGGGGHKGACGFRTKTLTFIK